MRKNNGEVFLLKVNDAGNLMVLELITSWPVRSRKFPENNKI